MGRTHWSVCCCCEVSRVGWRNIHILCCVAFNETCCKNSWSKQQVGALRPFCAMWRPCPHRCAEAMYSRRLRPCRASLCCAFSFCRSILSNCSSTVSLHGPTWFQHGANMTPTMAPTVHNMTIWFEHILSLSVPSLPSWPSFRRKHWNPRVAFLSGRNTWVAWHFPSYWICCLLQHFCFCKVGTTGWNLTELWKVSSRAG